MGRKFAIICLVVVFVAICFAVHFYTKSMTPTLLKYAEVKAQSEATRAINEAIISVFSNVDYSNLVSVEKNNDNEVTMLSANSGIVNNLAFNTSVLTQAKLNVLFEDDIKIPLGTLSGIPLLSERGPFVNIEVAPIGSVSCSFYSEFESAGINQTLHRIFLNVESVVDLIIPSMHKTLTIETPVLLCESVIVGKVPETFLQGSMYWGGEQVAN